MIELNSRALSTIRALRIMGINNSVLRSILSDIANDESLYTDIRGHQGEPINSARLAAMDALAPSSHLHYTTEIMSFGFVDSMDPERPPGSSDYPLNSNFVADWESYLQTIRNLPPNSADRLSILKSDSFADGQDGWSIHRAALSGLEMGSFSENLNILSEVIKSQNRRGNRFALEVIQKFGKGFETSAAHHEAIVNRMHYDVLGGGLTIAHKSEFVRAQAIRHIGVGCAVYRYEHDGAESQECLAAYEKLEHLKQRDWSRDVRRESLIVLASRQSGI